MESPQAPIRATDSASARTDGAHRIARTRRESSPGARPWRFDTPWESFPDSFIANLSLLHLRRRETVNRCARQAEVWLRIPGRTACLLLTSSSREVGDAANPRHDCGRS